MAAPSPKAQTDLETPPAILRIGPAANPPVETMAIGRQADKALFAMRFRHGIASAQAALAEPSSPPDRSRLRRLGLAWLFLLLMAALWAPAVLVLSGSGLRSPSVADRD
jgi:hypothetical protein